MCFHVCTLQNSEYTVPSNRVGSVKEYKEQEEEKEERERRRILIDCFQDWCVIVGHQIETWTTSRSRYDWTIGDLISPCTQVY